MVPHHPGRLAATLLCLLALTAVNAAARPAEPWSGPRGDYLFLEAESFSPQGRGWQVVESARGYTAVIASGMKALSGAGSGAGTATHGTTIPASGTWRLWVRFTQVQNAAAKFRGPFRLSVTQNAKTAFDAVYDQALDTATPGGNAVQAPLRWLELPATLAKGPATFTLAKVGPDAVDPRARQVDCLLLTTDGKYQPDERDFAPQTYMRIKLASADPQRVYFYMFLDHMRNPWYENIYADSQGLGPPGSVAGDERNYLQAGQSTSWMNISRLLYADSESHISFHATVRYRNPDAAASAYSVDFATAPSDAAIVKTITRTGAGNGLQVVVPPDLEDHRLPMGDMDFAAQTATTVARLPAVTFGRRPVKFPLVTDLSTDPTSNSPEARDLEFKAIDYLGLSGLARPLGPSDVAAGLHFGAGGVFLWHMGPAGYNEPQVQKIEEAAWQGAETYRQSPPSGTTAQFLLMDEAGAKELPAMVANATDQKAFVAWAQGHKMTPEALGVASWDQVRLTADRHTVHPALYALSQRFRAWSVANFFRTCTAAVRKNYPQGILASENFSDGAVYLANLYAQGNDYFEYFKNGALDAATTEDWTNNGATYELAGWNAALLRSATKYKGQPIHMYDITSFGRTPLDVKLKAYSDMAQGTSYLDFYAYMPPYAGHENGWYHHWTMYPAVAEVCHEVGAAEDVLVGAKPHPAQTAIIYSIPSDIWTVGVDNSQGCERMFTYLALRHAQVPVDVLSDEDARGTYLSPYKVAYLFGDQLDAATVAPLAAWVRGGGTLVLSPGAATRDALNQPSDALDKAMGIARGPVQVLQGYDNASLFLPVSLAPQGQVQLLDDGGKPVEPTVALLAQRQALQPGPGATIHARFADGSPACVDTPVGKGHVVALGFLPAMAYVDEALIQQKKTAAHEEVVPLRCVAQTLVATDPTYDGKPVADIRIPRHQYSQCPYRYPGNLRRFITAPTRRAGVEEPVGVDHAQVEATLMESPHGWAVLLANYTGQPLDAVTVTIQAKATALSSARQGALKAVALPGGASRVTIPLESTDIIYSGD